MKYVYFGFNALLIVLICLLTFYDPKENIVSANFISKSLTTTKISEVQLNLSNALNNSDNNTADDNNQEEELSEDILSTEEFDKKVVENIVPASVISDVLETQVGTMSAYGPDCVGCSGHLAGGFDASGGATIYHDDTYGDVRIVAGDPSYPMGSIFRVTGSSLGDFYAIVLDRGGAIGIGRRFLFDLLCSSEAEASNIGTNRNVTFELVRRGY